MSKERLNLPVIEWSPSRVTVYDPQTRHYATGANVSEVAHYIEGAKTVVVALSRRSSFIRTVRVPDAPKAQIAQVLKLQLSTLLPIAGNEAAYDFRLTKDVNSEGRLAVIAAVQSETLRQVNRELKAAGLTAYCIVPTAFGSWLLTRTLEIPKCAVVEHTPEGLAIDIVADEELRYTRVVPFPPDAEEIEAEICRTFSIAHVPCSTIVATAGLTFHGADTTVATRPLEIFSTPLLSKLNLDIELPEAIESRERKAVAVRARVAILMWVAVFVVGLYVFTDRADAAAKAKAAQSIFLVVTAKLKSKDASYKLQLADDNKMQTDLETAFHPAQHMSDLLAVISNEAPANVWLTGITLERGKQVLVRGTAMTSEQVASYVQTLAAEPRLRDVKLIFANNATIEQTPIVQFSIQAHAVGNLPIVYTAGGKK